MKKDFVSLAEARPDLAKEGNYEKNGDLKPEDVSCGSKRKVWWVQYDKSPVTGEVIALEWKASIVGRAKRNYGNPIKSGYQVLKGYNDLATLRPDIASEWNYERNGNLKPDMVTCGSQRKVWWVQYKINDINNKIIKLEWEAVIATRIKGCQNPFDAGQCVLKGYNDLATLRPDIASEWNYKRNGNLRPDMVTCGANKKVWWVQYDKSPITGKMVTLEWEAYVNSRAMKGETNPFKLNRKILKGYNDLATIRPDLAKEWNYEKNGDLKPDIIGCGYKKSVWWVQYDKSPVTGETMALEWKASVVNRAIKGLGNPYKTGQKVLKGYNDLSTLCPGIASEWNYERNGDLKPDMVTCGTHKKVWWIQYDKNPITGNEVKFEWQSSIKGRVNGNGNPYKTGQKVLKGYNDLSALCPDIASEWNYERNGNLKPDMVTCGTNKKVWWVQYDKSPVTGEVIALEWKASIVNRVKGAQNPIKIGRLLLKGYNDLASLRPDLALEWDYKQNGNLKPDMVTCGLNKKVWWTQKVRDEKTGDIVEYKWKSSIFGRVKGNGNPYLTIYKGEEYIKKYLQKNNISFNAQQKFSDLLGTGDGQLSYDFSIPDEKYGYILIEYNGIQHYESVEYWGGEAAFKKQKEHDKRKRDYAKKHGYKLITIKYTYDTYESVEEYLDKELKKLGVINDSVNLCSPSPDVDGVSGSPYTSSNHQTDGQPKIGHGFPSIDDTKKEESVNDAA